MILSQKRHFRGFSLIELLVVILIISLLLTLGAVGLRGISGGNGIASAVATSEAIFDEARSIAVGKGTKSRVLVDITDPQDDKNYLRRILVAYQELDDNGEPTEEWALSSRALNLPDRIFFSKEFSKKEHEGGGELEEDSFTFGKSQFDGKYIYYEFNSEGICATPGASFVMGSGVRPKGEEPRATADGKRDFGGFVIWRNGRTSLFRGPEQIGIPSEVTQF